MFKPLCLLFAFFPGCAAAQTFPTIPASTVVGRTAIGPGPAQAIPYSQLISSLLTVPFVGTLTIEPVAGTINQGLLINQTPAGAINTTYNLNLITIAQDQIDAGVNGVNWFASYGSAGGSALKGGRTALLGSLGWVAASNSGNTNRNYTAVGGIVAVDADDGGGVGTEKGAFFGSNFVGSTTGANATNLLAVHAGEDNLLIASGSTLKYSAIRTFVLSDGHAVRGGTYDAMLALSAQSTVGASGRMLHAMLIGDMNGTYPIATTGKIIGTTGMGSATIAYGIDLSGIGTISTAAFASPNFSVNGAGLISALATTGTHTISSGGAAPMIIKTSGSGTNLVALQTTAASQLNVLEFDEQTTAKWIIGKFTDNSFQIFDSAAVAAVVTLPTNSALVNITGAATTTSYLSVGTKIRATGSAPALSSCGGGSPAISGSDLAGEVTMGTSATACTITFNVTYAAVPYCVVTWPAQILASQSYSVSASAITLTQTSTSGNKVYYHCMARSAG